MRSHALSAKFLGVLAAFLPAILIAALFFAVLNNGAEAMSISANVPVEIATVIQALVVLFLLGGDALARRFSED